VVIGKKSVTAVTATLKSY